MNAPTPQETLAARVRRAAKVAAAEADTVDQEGRTPDAAIGALREERLLAPGPGDGGRWWTAREIAAVSSALGGACASTGMIWAMHQGQLLSIARQPTATDELTKFVAGTWQAQPLIASLMSERGAADPRQGNAFCDRSPDGGLTVVKEVSVSSYLAVADAALVVARRDAAAPLSDQVLVVADRAGIDIANPVPWNAMGMRGTASGGCRATVSSRADMVLAEPFAVTGAQVMTPLTHLGWAGCWWGIASAAADRARRFLRRRASGGASDLLAAKTVRLGRIAQSLDQSRAQIRAFANEYDAAAVAGVHPAGMPRRANNVRLAVAELAFTAVVDAIELIGVDAYREAESSRFSLSRHLRDVTSARVMISSDRIRLANGTLALMPDGDLVDELDGRG
ncbi:acyl-CoA dehydrogenase family protein [Micromonospora sp. B006]|uniref:acyl-CoA dehydrogenase family protein n=1 Tax=Micromonospora sp. B006 TaxID=2201999 RepID=UPI000E302A00|nr:acyl-CoA dehydrogenase family protein [Micromonospora sp. B006]AXO35400.1 acyl-CoA dehydrogenase [Micromonospora sp. B006]